MLKLGLVIRVVLVAVVCPVAVSAQGIPPKVNKPPQPNGPVSKAPVTIPKIALPDLRVDSAQIADGKLVVKYLNQCSAKITAPYVRIKVEVYKDATFKQAVNEIGVDGVPPGPKGSAINTITMPASNGVSSFTGTSYRITLDPANKIKESSESNNVHQSGKGYFPDSSTLCNPQ